MCTNLGDFSKFFQAAREGHGKTEKQQHSPEATVALELGGNLQYGSKIRFKLKKKKKKESRVVQRDLGTRKHRAGQAGKCPLL